MPSSFSAIAIIPARLASTRLPRKVLREIAGQPMIARVYEAAKQSPLLRDVIIATDSEEVMQFAQTRGWKAQMTSDKHRSGTDRVYEVAQRIPADVYVNIQGDEPLARPEHLDALLQPMQDPRVMVSTIKTPCPPQDVDNPNAVKVVTDLNGRALYFSRSTIPFDRDKTGVVTYFKHLGFYAYRRLRWIGSATCRNQSWKQRSGWSNCDFWITESIFTWRRRHSTPWAWIRKKICVGWKRWYERPASRRKHLPQIYADETLIEKNLYDFL